MDSGKGKVYKWIFLLNVLSRCILFTLLLTQVNSSSDSVSSTNNSTVRSDIFGQTLLSENEKNIHEESSPKIDLTEKVYEYAEQKSIPESLGSQEFIFAEVLSQNSAVVNGGSQLENVNISCFIVRRLVLRVSVRLVHEKQSKVWKKQSKELKKFIQLREVKLSDK